MTWRIFRWQETKGEHKKKQQKWNISLEKLSYLTQPTFYLFSCYQPDNCSYVSQTQLLQKTKRGEKKNHIKDSEQFQGRLSKLWNYCLGWWKNPTGGTDWTKPATRRRESHRDFVRAVRKHHGTRMSRATTTSVRSLWKRKMRKRNLWKRLAEGLLLLQTLKTPSPLQKTHLNYANFYSLPQAQILFKLNTPSQKRAN